MLPVLVVLCIPSLGLLQVWWICWTYDCWGVRAREAMVGWYILSHKVTRHHKTIFQAVRNVTCCSALLWLIMQSVAATLRVLVEAWSNNCFCCVCPWFCLYAWVTLVFPGIHYQFVISVLISAWSVCSEVAFAWCSYGKSYNIVFQKEVCL